MIMLVFVVMGLFSFQRLKVDQFPNIDLFNGEFDKVKNDNNGLAILDFKGEYVYEKVIGLLEFEVKNMFSTYFWRT